MIIDLKMQGSLTLESVAALISSKDDSKHRQIRVTTDGIVSLSDEIGNVNAEGVLFALETTVAGNGYSGVEASEDERWVKEVLELLRTEWSRLGRSFAADQR
jgi:hypothetical protein